MEGLLMCRTGLSTNSVLLLINSRLYIHQLSIHKQWLAQSLMGRQSCGLFYKNNKSNPLVQSRRNYGDSAVDFPNHVPLARYEGFVRLLVDSAPVDFCQSSLVCLHASTGLPWWAIVILGTFTTRMLVTLPLSLYQHVFASVVNLKHEMDDLVKELKIETNRAVDILGWTETYARRQYNRSLKKQWKKLIVRDNCHPAKGLIVVLAQVPMWIVISAGLRNLCFMLPQPTEAAQETYIQLSAEGFGWITNLTAVDSYWILPVSLGVINLLNIEIQNMLRTQELSSTGKTVMNVVRGFSLVMVPLAGVVPSCMSLYWVTSSAYGILQSLIIVSPRIRQLVRIPKTERDLENPYRQLYDKIKKRAAWKDTRQVA